MNTVTIIEPTTALIEKTLRIAAYCRVSTQFEEQESSLKAQVANFMNISLCESHAYAQIEPGLRIKLSHYHATTEPMENCLL